MSRGTIWTRLCRRAGVAIGPRGVGTVSSRVGLKRKAKMGAVESADRDVSALPSGGLRGYRPSPDEDFMNPRQMDYFRAKLLEWREDLLRESRETLASLQSDSLREPDVTDRASSETDWSIELRTRDRQRKLLAKIDAALRRLDEGEYGYCEV